MDEPLYKPTTPSDYEHFRDRLDAAGILWCPAGGQAVNIWALHYVKEHPLIAALSPFTSKDIDPLLLSLNKIDQCPELKVSGWMGTTAIGGVVVDPQTGHMGEILKFLPGVPDDQWRDRLRMMDNWPVIPPDALYASKCWNLLNVPQEGRSDLRHLLLLNYVLEAHLAHVDEAEMSAIKETFQRLADTGILGRVIEIVGPHIATAITPHIDLPEKPAPVFYVSSGLYEEIRKLPSNAPNVHTLSNREQEWATLVVQFHNEKEAEETFISQYGVAVNKHIETLEKGISQCRD